MTCWKLRPILVVEAFLVLWSQILASTVRTCSICICKRGTHEDGAFRQSGSIVNCTNKNINETTLQQIPFEYDIYLFRGNPHLFLHDNSLSRFHNMKVLTLSEANTKYSEHIFANNTKLLAVTFSNTYLTEVSPLLFNHTRSLRIVNNLHASYIHEKLFYPLETLQRLEIITLQTNLSVKMFMKNQHLQNLTIVANNLEILPVTLLPPRITKLRISSDRISSIHRDFLRDSISLKEIEIVGGSISMTERLVSYEAYDLVVRLIDLKHLNYTAVNQDIYIKGLHLFNVKSVKCNPDLLPEQRITDELSISNSSITELADGCLLHMANVKYLNFSHNRIETLSFPSATNPWNPLNVLDLSHNKIRSLPMDNLELLRNLKSLYLHHNLLTEINAEFLSLLTNLQHLRLDNNNITLISDITFMDQQSLEYLDLSYNMIDYVPLYAFNGLRMLQDLIMTNNFLKAFRVDLFNAANLRLLDLSHNHLTFLDTILLPCPVGTLTVKLLENKVHCGCVLMPMMTCESSVGIGKCFTPIPLQNKNITDLMASDVCSEDFQELLYPVKMLELNGTRIGITLYNGERNAVWEDLSRLRHNGSHLIIGNYIRSTDGITIDCNSSSIVFTIMGQPVLTLPLTRPVFLERNKIVLSVTENKSLRINFMKAFVNFSSNHIDMGDISLNWSASGHVRLKVDWQSLTIADDIGPLFYCKLPIASLLINNSEIDFRDDLKLILPTDMELIAVVYEHNTSLVSYEGDTVVYFEIHPSVVHISSEMLIISGGEMSIRMTVPGPVHINETSTYIMKDDHMKAVIQHPENISIFWNGSHLLYGDVIAEATGLLVFSPNIIQINDPSRKISLLNINQSSTTWNSTHLVVDGFTGITAGRAILFAVVGVPTYNGSALHFMDENKTIAIVFVEDSYPVFEEQAIHFAGNYQITLYNNGLSLVNDSHVVVKRSVDVDKTGEVTGVFSAPGKSHFNTTHVIKTDTRNRTRAVLSLSSAYKYGNSHKALPRNGSFKPIVRLYVRDGMTSIQYSERIAMMNYTATPYYDGASIIRVGSTTLIADGVPDVHNRSFLVIPNKNTIYEIRLYDVVQIIYKLESYVLFATSSGQHHMKLAMQGHLLKSDSQCVIIHNQNSTVMNFLDSAFSYPLTAFYDGESLVKLGDNFVVECSNSSFIRLDRNGLRVYGNENLTCFAIKEMIVSEIKNHSLMVNHSIAMSGQYLLNGWALLTTDSIQYFIISDSGNRLKGLIHPGGQLVIQNGVISFYQGDATTSDFRFFVDSPLLVKQNSLAAFSNTHVLKKVISSQQIRSIVISNDKVLFKGLSNSWASMAAPATVLKEGNNIKFFTSGTQATPSVIYELGRSLTNLELRVGHIYYKDRLISSFDIFKGKAVTAADSVYMNIPEDVCIVTGSELRIGMMTIQEKEDKGTVSVLSDANHIHIRWKNQLHLAVVITKYIATVLDQYVIYRDEDAIKILIEYPAEEKPAVVNGTHLLILRRNQPLPLILVSNVTDVIIDHQGIFLFNGPDHSDDSPHLRGHIVTNGTIHYNGSSVLYVNALGQLEASVVVDMFGNPVINILMAMNDKRIFIKNGGINAAEIIVAETMAQVWTLNKTHIIYGTRNESLFCEGKVTIQNTTHMAIISSASGQNELVLNFEQPQNLVVNVRDVGVAINYTTEQLVISIPGVVSQIYGEYNEIIVSVNGSRDIRIPYEEISRSGLIDETIIYNIKRSDNVSMEFHVAEGFQSYLSSLLIRTTEADTSADPSMNHPITSSRDSLLPTGSMDSKDSVARPGETENATDIFESQLNRTGMISEISHQITSVTEKSRTLLHMIESSTESQRMLSHIEETSPQVLSNTDLSPDESGKSSRSENQQHMNMEWSTETTTIAVEPDSSSGTLGGSSTLLPSGQLLERSNTQTEASYLFQRDTTDAYRFVHASLNQSPAERDPTPSIKISNDSTALNFHTLSDLDQNTATRTHYKTTRSSLSRNVYKNAPNTSQETDNSTSITSQWLLEENGETDDSTSIITKKDDTEYTHSSREIDDSTDTNTQEDLTQDSLTSQETHNSMELTTQKDFMDEIHNLTASDNWTKPVTDSPKYRAAIGSVKTIKTDYHDERFAVKVAYFTLISVAVVFMLGGIVMFMWNKFYFSGESYEL